VQRLVPLNVYAAATEPSASRTGDLYYNTEKRTVYVYNGEAWVVSVGYIPIDGGNATSIYGGVLMTIDGGVA
jgi:hypothetical protein